MKMSKTNQFYSARPGTLGRGGGQFPGRQITIGAPNLCWDTKRLRRVSKRPNNITSNVFNTVPELPKDLRFEHGGARVASCPGCLLTSLERQRQELRQLHNVRLGSSHAAKNNEAVVLWRNNSILHAIH